MAVDHSGPVEAPFDWSVVKFLAFPVLSTLVVLEIAFGGPWMWAVLPTYLVIALVGDQSLGDDLSRASTLRRRLLDAYLYSGLPLAILATLLLAAHAGGSAPVWLGAPFSIFGIDLATRVQLTSSWDVAAAVVGLGLFYGTLVNVAHELVHRTGNRSAWLTGRWLLAHTFDTGFAIEHVHGHHRYVGTPRDPATSHRGEYVLAFVWRSTIGQIASAWRIERDRLRRRSLPVLSHHNLMLRGQVMSLALVMIVYAVGGWAGVGAFVAAGLLGKVSLELVNYVEHYGLARVEGSRVRPHHSWNCHNRLSTWILFNLPRHSDHHMFATRPYYDLRPVPELQSDAPVLPLGYLGCMAASLWPPLWKRLMEPRLADWDERLASSEEVGAAKAMAH